MDLDSVADELYSLPPEDFTAARDAVVKAASDPALKKAIKVLRKPTVAAYEVNRIVRDRADAVDALLDLGDELRAAMSGQGGDLRQLTEQRRAAVSDLVPADLAANLRDDVTATFEAATADPELGAAVRSGRLVKPLRYAGFGTLPDLDDVVATPIANKRRAVAKKAAAQKTAAKKLAVKKPQPPQPDLAPMRQRILDLAGVADDAQRRYDEAVRAAHQARELLQRAEEARAAAHRAAKEAHAAVEKARRELGKLERS